MLRLFRSCSSLALALAALPVSAAAPVVFPPLEQLEKNVRAFAHEHPDDAHEQYVLGRLHYFAYVALRSGATNEIVSNRYSLEDVPSLPATVREPDPSAVIDARRRELKEAIRGLRAALVINPKEPQFELTLAALFEYAATDDALGDMLPPGDPAKERKLYPATRRRFEALLQAIHPASGQADADALRGLRKESCFGARVLQKLSGDNANARLELAAQRRRCWDDRAIDAYWDTLQLESQLNASVRSPSGIVQKAAGGYKRLVKERGEGPDERLKWVEENHAWLTSPPVPESMSAVVVSLAMLAPEELASEEPVSFDVDGCGPHEWTWLRPEVGMFTWTPDGQGVSAAWRILGTAWYFMHWPSGYRALDALDANRDGVLSGDELRGVGVWTDKHSDAKCDAGEVVPVDKLGIVEIAVQPKDAHGNPHGVKLRDGRTLPTYDWSPQLSVHLQ